MTAQMNTQTTNIGWYYYKQYYWDFLKNPEKNPLSGNLKKTIEIQLVKNQVRADLISQKLQSIDLQVIYPGLLVGSGYLHETGSLGEFKLGFHFDYTSGLPTIPGSSLKGTLRSCFPAKEKIHDLKTEKTRFIHRLIPEAKEDQIELIELEIFEGKDSQKENSGFLPIYKRDVFLDAVLSNKNPDNVPIFGSDFITPHPDPLGDPNPIQFLKILPEVIISFNFNLKDSPNFLFLTSKRKQELFKEILLTIGIGAKTNVGYGQFKEYTGMATPPQPNAPRNQPQAETAPTPIPPKHVQVDPKDQIPDSMFPFLKQSNEPLEGEISQILGNKVEVKFWKNDKDKYASIVRKKIKNGKEELKDFSSLKVGQKVQVFINGDYVYTTTLNCSIKII